MSLRFFFDECTDEDVARALLALGVDVVTVTGLNRKGLSDPDHFAFCNRESRVVYTTDPDFLRLAADMLRRGQDFCGVVYHAQGSRTKREIIDALVLVNGVLEPDDLRNRIEFI